MDFAIDDVRHLIAKAEANTLALDPWLDNYVEAHIHGPIVIERDVEALILDPSFKDSQIEEAALSLGCSIEWHKGFCLSVHQSSECQEYRGPKVADAILEMARDSCITPAQLSQARETKLDYQTAKWVWHCMARFGYEQICGGCCKRASRL